MYIYGNKHSQIKHYYLVVYLVDRQETKVQEFNLHIWVFPKFDLTIYFRTLLLHTSFHSV